LHKPFAKAHNVLGEHKSKTKRSIRLVNGKNSRFQLHSPFHEIVQRLEEQRAAFVGKLALPGAIPECLIGWNKRENGMR